MHFQGCLLLGAHMTCSYWLNVAAPALHQQQCAQLCCACVLTLPKQHSTTRTPCRSPWKRHSCRSNSHVELDHLSGHAPLAACWAMRPRLQQVLQAPLVEDMPAEATRHVCRQHIFKAQAAINDAFCTPLCRQHTPVQHLTGCRVTSVAGARRKRI